MAGGSFRLGSEHGSAFVFDNETWAHPVEIAPFRSARAPVTIAAYAAFMDVGGYRDAAFWEWTASRFLPYLDFAPDAYEAYSQPAFGTCKVLRGGAWATRPQLAIGTYRNFFAPDRHDVIAAFRTLALRLRLRGEGSAGDHDGAVAPIPHHAEPLCPGTMPGPGRSRQPGSDASSCSASAPGLPGRGTPPRS